MNFDEPVISCRLAFSEQGMRSALRAGAQPMRQRTLDVLPGDPEWPQIAALLPHVAAGTDQKLVVNPQVTALLSAMPKSSSRHAGLHRLAEPITVLTLPHLTVTRGDEPQPLDEWPDTLEDLVELVTANEERIWNSLDAQAHELHAATVRWAESVPEFLDEIRARFETWTSNGALYAPHVFSTGAADSELIELGRALERVDQIHEWAPRTTSLAPHSRGTAVPDSVFADLPREVITSVLALEAAIEQVARAIATFDERSRKKLAKESIVRDAAAWVADHGSPRLRKATDAGLLHTSLGAYRDERLALEHPGWMWLPKDSAFPPNAPVNPSESLLDALLEARATVDPDSRPRHDRRSRLTIVVANYLGRQIWRPDLDGIGWTEHLQWLRAAPTLTFTPTEFLKALAS